MINSIKNLKYFLPFQVFNIIFFNPIVVVTTIVADTTTIWESKFESNFVILTKKNLVYHPKIKLFSYLSFSVSSCGGSTILKKLEAF